MENTTILGNDTCPFCGKVNDRHSPVEDILAKPKPGDYSVCISCGGILKFNSEMKMAKVGNKELDQMEEETFKTLFSASMLILTKRGL